jgi:glutathione S-transferase
VSVITLYQFEISPFCDKIRRILNVKGLSFEVREIPPTETLTTVRRVNKAAKLPCLDHDGKIVVDSTDIARFLEAKYPTPPLVPSDPRERALCHVLEDWADESLYFYEATMRFTWPENAARWVPELTRSEPAWLRPLTAPIIPRAVRSTVRAQGVGRKSREQILVDVGAHVAAVSDLLGDGDWLTGRALSVADIAVFAQLFCIRGTSDGARIVGEHGRVASWMARVDAATQPKRERARGPSAS